MQFCCIVFIIVLAVNSVNSRLVSESVYKINDESVKILCQNGAAEVVFVLDASTSVTVENFRKELAFVKQSIQLLSIGPNAIRVALVTYSTDVQVRIDLKSNATKSQLIRQVNLVTYDKGETYTRSALLHVYHKIFPSSRENVPQIIILVTDGRSSVHQDGSPISISWKLKEEGIKIIVVGVSNKIDQNELVSVASHKAFFMINNFDQLEAIYRNITKETCITIKTTPQPPISCNKRQLEMIFLIDSSQSISHNDFKSELGFVREFTKTLLIGKEDVRMALLSFHDEAEIEFNLNTYYSRNEILSAIKKVRHYGGGTAIGRALRAARTSVLPLSRDGVPRAIILITDGRNTGVYRPLKESRRIKSQNNTKIIVVGVSDQIDLYELKEISSSGKIHKVESFKTLVHHINSLMRDACD